MKTQLLQEFNINKSKYQKFCEKLTNLISELISNKNFSVHQINNRIKTEFSLSKKIDKKNKYKNLVEITDIIGIRIITHLDEDVDIIKEIIYSDFEIDNENSIDKRITKTNEFGYKSLHIVAQLNETRKKLPEYSHFEGIKFEIQIRSILQHAWAEIEHDLGYKSQVSIPQNLIRSFHRLSALLETADIEFSRLKSEIKKYDVEVSSKLEQETEPIEINKNSLIVLLNNNKILQEIREFAINNYNCDFTDKEDNPDIINKFIELFQIKSIQELENIINEDSHKIKNFIQDFIIGDDLDGYALNNLAIYFWIQHYLAGKTEDLSFVNTYLNFDSIPIGGQPAEYVDTYKKTKDIS